MFFKGRLLDVGCGKMPYKNYILQNGSVSEYVGLDIETAIEYDENVKPDYTWDGNVIPFESDSYDTIMATEVLEHCPFPSQTLGEMYRVLKKDGYIFLTVPFLWNLHETPHDEYRYTPFALRRLLSEAGFVNIEIKASGGWHASMAQMLGLWVRRSGLPRALKLFLSILLKPVIKCLMKKDRIPATFHEGAMIAGLYATAKKQF
jgi:SAM-dependent methyltransferase